MNPINKYVLIRVLKPVTKIGSIIIPDIGDGRLNTGEVVSYSSKLGDKLQVHDKVWFMEYRNSVWIDKEHIVVPYMSLNARQNVRNEVTATGTKILVRINKDRQRENRFVGKIKLLIPEFNNKYSFHNQFAECVSIGPEVRENIDIGETALFNQFIELSDEHLIEQIIEDGVVKSEIRAVETGSGFNYELYGFTNGKEFISTQNYVFVKPGDNGDSRIRNLPNSKLVIVEKEKSAYDFKYFTVLHKTADNKFKPGDLVTARGKSAKCGNLDIHYLPVDLITENLSNFVEGMGVKILEDRITLY